MSSQMPPVLPKTPSPGLLSSLLFVKFEGVFGEGLGLQGLQAPTSLCVRPKRAAMIALKLEVHQSEGNLRGALPHQPPAGLAAAGMNSFVSLVRWLGRKKQN